MTSRRPTSYPNRPRRYPAAYVRAVEVRPTDRPIRLTIGPAPVRLLRTVWSIACRVFGIQAVPSPHCVPTPSGLQRPLRRSTRPATTRPAGTPTPRCLHCKVVLAEKQALAQEPYGRWVRLRLRHRHVSGLWQQLPARGARLLPTHWQAGPPGQIVRIRRMRAPGTGRSDSCPPSERRARVDASTDVL